MNISLPSSTPLVYRKLSHDSQSRLDPINNNLKGFAPSVGSLTRPSRDCSPLGTRNRLARDKSPLVNPSAPSVTGRKISTMQHRKMTKSQSDNSDNSSKRQKPSQEAVIKNAILRMEKNAEKPETTSAAETEKRKNKRKSRGDIASIHKVTSQSSHTIKSKESAEKPIGQPGSESVTSPFEIRPRRNSMKKVGDAAYEHAEVISRK